MEIAHGGRCTAQHCRAMHGDLILTYFMGSKSVLWPRTLEFKSLRASKPMERRMAENTDWKDDRCRPKPGDACGMKITIQGGNFEP
jgi:hypothetical protein